MEMNFAFLEKKQEYELFSGACIDAERILESSPVMSAVASSIGIVCEMDLFD